MTITIEIPALETERLTLAIPGAADAAAAVELYGGPRAVGFGGPFPEPAAWRRFAFDLGHWTLRGYGMWTVRERVGATFRGLVGCWFPHGRPEREIGWFVTDEGEGRGIAYEAALAARSDAYCRLGWDGCVSCIHPENTRSRRLAERLGAQPDPDAELPEGETPESCLVYRHPAPEALQ